MCAQDTGKNLIALLQLMSHKWVVGDFVGLVRLNATMVTSHELAGTFYRGTEVIDLETDSHLTVNFHVDEIHSYTYTFCSFCIRTSVPHLKVATLSLVYISQGSFQLWKHI